MRQFVRSGLIASIVVVLAAVAGAQAPSAGQPGNPAAAKVAPTPRPAILDQVLATVNGETITRAELYRLFDTVGVPTGSDEQDVYRTGIEQLVNTKLVKQYLLKQTSLVVPEEKVDAEFAETEKKLKQDGQDIYVVLASNGVTVSSVRDEMRLRLRWTMYLDAVSSKENLEKFVASNKDVFNRTQVKASHIVLRVEPDTPAAEKAKIKEKLAAIKRDIDSNKISFADAANKYSEDEGNKQSPSGGDLGYFVRRAFNEQFTSAAFSLKKGVISDPVESPFGFHLILVTDRKEGTPVDFEQNKLLIKSDYAADVHERIIAEMRKTAKIEVKPMPADLFPKAPAPPAGGAPAEPAKTAVPPKSAAPSKPATPK